MLPPHSAMACRANKSSVQHAISHAKGKIAAVDHHKHTLVIQGDAKQGSQSILWNQHTKILAAGKSVSTQHLHVGAQVHVAFHTHGKGAASEINLAAHLPPG